MTLAVLAARYWPFANGSGRIIDRFARGVDLGQGERLAQTSDGFALRVRADDLIGRHILLTGRFDRSVVQVLLDHARPGDVLLDIGANIGYVAACFLSRIADSSAICVEPQPEIVDLLEANMAPFGDRVAIHRVALSDAAGEVRFRIDQANRGASRIDADGEFAVPAMHAGELLAGLPRLDLIKMDVEGHEETVFRAIDVQLARLAPRAILFEDQGAGAAEAIGALLHRHRYTVFGIDKRLLRTRLVPIVSSGDCRYNDYLAVRT